MKPRLRQTPTLPPLLLFAFSRLIFLMAGLMSLAEAALAAERVSVPPEQSSPAPTVQTRTLRPRRGTNDV